MTNRELETRYMQMKLMWKNLINANVELVDENKMLKENIERLNNKHNKAIEKINDYKIYCENNKGFTEYTDIEIEAIEPVISKLEDILKEEK